MLTEQQIIELAEQAGFDIRYGHIWANAPNDEPCSAFHIDDELKKFANALHAEFIKNLGEPKAYLYESSKATDLVQRKFNDDICKYLPKDCVITELYALPNDEVK